MKNFTLKKIKSLTLSGKKQSAVNVKRAVKYLCETN